VEYLNKNDLGGRHTCLPPDFFRHKIMLLIGSLFPLLFFLLYGFDYLTVGVSVPNLSDPDFCFLSFFSSWDEDDETFDLRYSIAASADLSDGNIVFLAHFDRLRFERPWTTEATTSVATSAFVTYIFSTPSALLRWTEGSNCHIYSYCFDQCLFL